MSTPSSSINLKSVHARAYYLPNLSSNISPGARYPSPLSWLLDPLAPLAELLVPSSPSFALLTLSLLSRALASLFASCAILCCSLSSGEVGALAARAAEGGRLVLIGGGMGCWFADEEEEVEGWEEEEEWVGRWPR